MKPKRINGLCPLMNLNLLPVSRKKKPLPKPITRCSMLIKKLLFIIICIASFAACNIESGKRETSDSKTVSQLDTVWKEVVPFKKKHDILDTNTVLVRYQRLHNAKIIFIF
jgi:uncharacterized lipoprotein YajG